MTQFTTSEQDALLRWINTFDTKRKAASLVDLQDGIILGQTLEQMLGQEFQSSSLIQHPSSREDNRQNLEIVYRGLASFLRGDNPYLAPSPSEFRAIAENPDDHAMCEFLSAFLAAACLGDLSRVYVPEIMRLDRPSQKEIANIINHLNELKADREAGAFDGDLPQGELDESLDYHTMRDPDLMEEELYQIKEKYETLRKQNADLQSRIDKLLDTREAVLHDLRVAQDELTAERRTRGSDVSGAVRDLRNELREKMSEIDRLEDLFQKETLRATRFEKENEALRAKAERLKDFEDKVLLLEHETKQQQQQIKGLENYKKKAQDLTVIQQRNRVLDEQIMQLEQDLKDFEELKMANRRLQKEIEEKSRVLANNEQEIIYTIQSKNVLQDTNEELKRRIEYLESKRQLDESTIKDLQEQLQLADVPYTVSHSPGASTSKFNLEQELETTTDPVVALRVEISRLKAENNVLRNNMTVASENEKLRGELDAANQKVEHYRLQCTEAMEKQAVAQEQINAIISGVTSEEDTAFIKLRRELLEASQKVETYQKRVQELERSTADKERELIHTKTDLAVISDEQAAALGALKASDELISESLKTELAATRRQLAQKTFELDEMKEQLMGALVSKDKLRRQLDDAIAAASNGQTAPEEAPRGKKEDAEKVDKLRAALRQKIEQLDKAEQEKYELQRRVKVAENGGAYAAQKAAYDQEIKTLRRENAMMTTAWYDITSRLQSNHVILQRRQEAPRSWLNKQRQMVNATPRR